jgi:hypothetical protein
MILKEEILFSKEECQSIIWDETRNVTDWNMGNRKYRSSLIEYNEYTKWIFDKLKYFFEIETGIKITNKKNRIHFHRFVEGDWFGKHNDIREERLYGVGVLLNDDFNGGDFKMYNPDEMILDKVIGNTYIFDVRIEHEITSVLNGERYSLLWFLQNEHIKMETNKLI